MGLTTSYRPHSRVAIDVSGISVSGKADMGLDRESDHTLPLKG